MRGKRTGGKEYLRTSARKHVILDLCQPLFRDVFSWRCEFEKCLTLSGDIEEADIVSYVYHCSVQDDAHL